MISKAHYAPFLLIYIEWSCIKLIQKIDIQSGFKGAKLILSLCLY
ncbi:hypothetical protein HMPREF0023_2334 [Acinetobacter sp. ATCC 27244]|nr:hypothetical protein HMPREF0023_2334 [Acinetobacter sp. ATCC 27244]